MRRHADVMAIVLIAASLLGGCSSSKDPLREATAKLAQAVADQASGEPPGSIAKITLTTTTKEHLNKNGKWIVDGITQTCEGSTAQDKQTCQDSFTGKGCKNTDTGATCHIP